MVATRKQDYGVGQPVSKHDEHKENEVGVSDSELPSTQRINKSVTPSTSRRRRANRKSQEKKSVTNNIRRPKSLPVDDQSTTIVPSYIPVTNERSLEDQLIENVNSQTTERPPIIEDVSRNNIQQTRQDFFVAMIYAIWIKFISMIANVSVEIRKFLVGHKITLILVIVFILFFILLKSTDDVDEVSIISDNETRQYDDIYDLLMSKIGSMLGSNYGPKTIPPMLDVHMNLEQSIQKVDEMLRKTVPPIVERVLREKYGSIILPDKEQLNEWVMSAAHNLVQEYIKTDIRNMPDFALSSGGARIIHSLTSRPYSEMPNTKFHKMFSLLLYNGYVHGHKPHVAIDGNNQIGNCFAFSGMRGQLAIQLSRTIYITSVSYQHLDRNLALDDTNILSAPARFAVLGIPDEKYLSNSTSKALEVSQGFVRLGEFIYDLEGPPVQIFQVEHKNGSERIPIKSIIFKVNSNWGHDRYTCLYQFKVHGRNVRNVLRQHQKLPYSKTFESTPVVT
ncbi:UNC-like C-terminal-domain-containing protein [Gigaspora rosea]|uniref:UNC-like C-terminal-domain-containing protein n=1 Tax=Gigaspora rosea TaxID=44941 RepID=A0A397UUQ9_9GLOM|nr:UNC-like C-terminal-domain-containing protein [Gigaspora rosea]